MILICFYHFRYSPERAARSACPLEQNRNKEIFAQLFSADRTRKKTCDDGKKKSTKLQTTQKRKQYKKEIGIIFTSIFSRSVHPSLIRMHHHHTSEWERERRVGRKERKGIKGRGVRSALCVPGMMMRSRIRRRSSVLLLLLRLLSTRVHLGIPGNIRR